MQHEHIRMLGHYSFSLVEPILSGEHRPLNQEKLAAGGDSRSLLTTLDDKLDNE